jgi:hypothetical protein
LVLITNQNIDTEKIKNSQPQPEITSNNGSMMLLELTKSSIIITNYVQTTVTSNSI